MHEFLKSKAAQFHGLRVVCSAGGVPSTTARLPSATAGFPSTTAAHGLSTPADGVTAPADGVPSSPAPSAHPCPASGKSSHHSVVLKSYHICVGKVSDVLIIACSQLLFHRTFNRDIYTNDWG